MMDLVAKVVLWISKIYNDRVYPYDLEEPLKLPEEFIEAVEESKETGDHSEIHRILRNQNINLGN